MKQWTALQSVSNIETRVKRQIRSWDTVCATKGIISLEVKDLAHFKEKIPFLEAVTAWPSKNLWTGNVNLISHLNLKGFSSKCIKVRLQERFASVSVPESFLDQFQLLAWGTWNQRIETQCEPCPVYANGSAPRRVYNLRGYWVPNACSPDVDVMVGNGILDL